MKKLLALLLLMVCSFVACKKKTNESPKEDEPIETIKDPHINDNVKILDSTVLVLNSTTEMIESGKLEYKIVDKTPKLQVGDVILGTQIPGGYSGKITAITRNGQTLSLSTVPVSLDEVFSNATIRFPMASMKDIASQQSNSKISSKGISSGNAAISQIKIENKEYIHKNMRIKLDSCFVSLDGDWILDAEFGTLSVKSLDFGLSDQSKLVGNFKAQFSIAQPKTEIKDSILISSSDFYVRGFIPGTPIIILSKVTREIYLKYKGNINIQSAVTIRAHAEKNFKAMVHYSSTRGWDNVFESGATKASASYNLSTNSISGELQAQLAMRFKFDVYGMPVTYAEIGAVGYGKFGLSLINYSNPQMESGANLVFNAGLQESILSRRLPRIDFNLTYNLFKYLNPYEIQLVEGDQQLGSVGRPLDKKFKVRVLDNMGSPIPFIYVNFRVTGGGGSLSNIDLLTDNDGYASASLTLANPGQASVEASVVTGGEVHSHIKNSPLIFTAKTYQTGPVQENCPTGSSSGVVAFRPAGRRVYSEQGQLLFTGDWYVSPAIDCKGKKQISVTYYTNDEPDEPKSKQVVTVDCDCR